MWSIDDDVGRGVAHLGLAMLQMVKQNGTVQSDIVEIILSCAVLDDDSACYEVDLPRFWPTYTADRADNELCSMVSRWTSTMAFFAEDSQFLFNLIQTHRCCKLWTRIY